MSTAQIFDRGYRPYDGPRLGLHGAVRSLTRHSIQRALGLKRTFWNKILPFLAIFLAYIPAIVFVGIAAFLKSRLSRSGVDLDRILPTYGEYYSFIWAAITVFAAFVAPEMLCTDRRTGMLGLYLASPLRRDSYLVAKAAAVGAVLLLVSLGPPLFMLVARTIAGSGPADLLAFLGILWRVLVSGVVVAALPAALSLALASTTTRRAAASAAFVLIEIGSVAVTQSLILAGNTPTLFVANLAYLPLELVVRIYGEPAGWTVSTAASVPTATLAVGYVVITAALAWFVWFRYRRIQVTR
jgi:ABC-2 type transport system permease protein